MSYNKDALGEELNQALSISNKKLDKYENLLIAHLTGNKNFDDKTREYLEASVDYYRSEVSRIRVPLISLHLSRFAEDTITDEPEMTKPEMEGLEEHDSEEEILFESDLEETR